jgi:hypothetical protein
MVIVPSPSPGALSISASRIDYRDWDDVDAWAGSIAEEIRSGSTPRRHGS